MKIKNKNDAESKVPFSLMHERLAFYSFFGIFLFWLLGALFRDFLSKLSGIHPKRDSSRKCFGFKLIAYLIDNNWLSTILFAKDHSDLKQSAFNVCKTITVQWERLFQEKSHFTEAQWADSWSSISYRWLSEIVHWTVSSAAQCPSNWVI